MRPVSSVDDKPVHLVARAVVVALAMVTAVTGCGRDRESPPSAREAEAARAALLRPEDLPGWQATPQTGSEGVSASERELARCLDRPDPAETIARRVRGDAYRNGQSYAAAEVAILQSSDDADRAVAGVLRGDSDRCIVQQVAGSIRGGSAELAAHDARVERFPPRVEGARGTGFRIAGTVRSPTGAVDLTADVVYLVSGRLELSLAFVGVGAPIDRTLQDRVIDRVGKRFVVAAQTER